jgi:large subunit ribosomal protein L3
MTISGLLGRKIGMTTHYREDGGTQAVTAIEVGPCVVTQVRTKGRDGYDAVQIGFGRARKLSKPEAGHLERSGAKASHLQEFKVKDLGEYEVGKTLRADVFQAGEIVRVTGRSRGMGYQGGMKRHNFHGGPKTHGQSDRQRAPGAISSTTHPGHVWKGTRMAGHMGDERVTVRGLEIVLADPERNLLLVGGAVPGPSNGVVRIEKLGRIKKKPPLQARKEEKKPGQAKTVAPAQGQKK